MTNRPTILLCFALGVCASAAAAPLAYVITGSQQFGEMDLATGDFSPIGSIPATIQYVAPGPNGSLLTMSFNGDLDAINPANGAISVVGNTGFADCSTPTTPTCGPNSQLSFGAFQGTLYATDFANNIYTIDPVTGQATLLGATGIPAVPAIPVSTNPDGSFNFYDENLFGVGGKLYANFDAGSFNPSTFMFTVAVSPELYEIDVNTGQATGIATTDFGLVTLANVNGTIYGFEGPTGQIVTLDVTNGSTNPISSPDPSLGLISGLAPTVPEPGSAALVLLGFFAAAARMRGTRRAHPSGATNTQ